MEGFAFSTSVRVRFADTDAQGVAHNAAYLVWFEIARVEHLREFAGGYQKLRDHGIEALVLESFCRYRIPAVFDDVLHVHARGMDVRGARFRYDYMIVRDDGVVVADGWTRHACVDAATLRPTRVPDWLVTALASAESSSASTSSRASSMSSTSPSMSS
jgi:acyl-CoA thioester hydrolase